MKCCTGWAVDGKLTRCDNPALILFLQGFFKIYIYSFASGICCTSIAALQVPCFPAYIWVTAPKTSSCYINKAGASPASTVMAAGSRASTAQGDDVPAPDGGWQSWGQPSGQPRSPPTSPPCHAVHHRLSPPRGRVCRVCAVHHQRCSPSLLSCNTANG